MPVLYHTLLRVITSLSVHQPLVPESPVKSCSTFPNLSATFSLRNVLPVTSSAEWCLDVMHTNQSMETCSRRGVVIITLGFVKLFQDDFGSWNGENEVVAHVNTVHVTALLLLVESPMCQTCMALVQCSNRGIQESSGVLNKAHCFGCLNYVTTLPADQA